MNDGHAPRNEIADRFFQVIPAEDYALLVTRDGLQYLERVVAFGVTEMGLNAPNPFRSQMGRLVPIVARVELIDGEPVSILKEGKGTLLHSSTYGTDQYKVAALKTGKPLGRL